jgi:hypothetical protein
MSSKKDLMDDMDVERSENLKTFSIFIEFGEDKFYGALNGTGIHEQMYKKGMAKTLDLRFLTLEDTLRCTSVPSFSPVYPSIKKILKDNGIKIKNLNETRPNLKTYRWTTFKAIPVEVTTTQIDGVFRSAHFQEVEQDQPAQDQEMGDILDPVGA